MRARDAHDYETLECYVYVIHDFVSEEAVIRDVDCKLSSNGVLKNDRQLMYKTLNN